MGLPEQLKLALALSPGALALAAAVAFQPVREGVASLRQLRISSETRGVKQFADNAHQSPSQSRKLLPVDEAGKDPSFKAFRDALIDAVKRKDTQSLLSVVAPDILSEFGGGIGIQNFKAKWRLGKATESKLWAELDTILSMGGTFQVEEGKKSFWAPYVFGAWPDDFDCGEAAECYAVTGDHVNVRREPSSAAPIVATLSYDIVKSEIQNPASSKTPEGWTRVTTPGGADGYVATRFLRSPTDYRAGFARVKGKWLMTAFIAGD